MLLGKTVVLGVSGGIAAWQTPEIIGQLKAEIAHGFLPVYALVNGKCRKT